MLNELESMYKKNKFIGEGDNWDNNFFAGTKIVLSGKIFVLGG